MKVWFSFMTMPECTRHRTLGTCSKFQLGNVWLSRIHSSLDTSDFHLLLWTCQTCYCHVADGIGTYVLRIWDGQTYQTPWKVPPSSRGQCWKMAYQGYIVYCQFPLLKLCLWLMGTINLFSDPPSYIHKCDTLSYTHNIKSQAHLALNEVFFGWF